MISDAQLWSASFLAQAVRAILPIGEIWNPILEELVEMIGILQTSNLRKVAFYVQTSNFVQWLKDNDTYKELRVTGHSLGVSAVDVDVNLMERCDNVLFFFCSFSHK